MSWQFGYPRYYATEINPTGRFQDSLGRLQVIERCFIRKDHDCGKIKGASKSCFVACPKEDELEPILELISEKLAKVGIEAIIAVKERAYGQDIFCTKICGKIIESKFCVVILDDEIDDGKNIPNPNVYYEYGLMTSMEKHIIPLQKEDLKLAFNIQSYDTIKYNSRNIGKELDRAIRDAIKITEEGTESTRRADFISQKSILRSFELAGFKIKGDSWFLDDVINDTDFRGFSHNEEGFYVYLGKVDQEEELNSYLEDISIVLYRTEKHYQELDIKIGDLNQELEAINNDRESSIRRLRGRSSKQVMRELEEWTVAKQQMSKMYIGFIISPSINRTNFMSEAKKLLSQQQRFELVVDKDNAIQFDSEKVILSVPAKSS